MSMIHDVSTDEAFLNLDQTELEAGTKLMESNGDLCVLLFVLVIIGKSDFAAWKIINLTF